MKRFRKIYLEISNVCNLKCAFCPGTRRKPAVMQEDAFCRLLDRLRGWTDYLYFHLMGEPLCHPYLEKYLALAAADFKVILTTNGTLLPQKQDMLLSAEGLHKVNISLHSFEANDIATSFEDYLSGCFSFGQAAQGKKIVCYRLWNQGGANEKNDAILKLMKHYFPDPWIQEPRGTRIGQRVYLEYGDKFDWPSLTAPEQTGKCFCYGLKDQLGILCDGTVVPCCLDHDGDIPLGNLLQQPLEEILSTPRAKAIYEGFLIGKAEEDLCRHCGYAKRFDK